MDLLLSPLFWSIRKKMSISCEQPQSMWLACVASRNNVVRNLLFTQPNSSRNLSVRILRSLFSPLLLDLYRLLIAPLQVGKVGAMVHHGCKGNLQLLQWLMGPYTVNSVDLPDGTSWSSGVSEFSQVHGRDKHNEWERSPLMQVFVEKCKYLEESKCVGIYYMGVAFAMEPNFVDHSHQVKPHDLYSSTHFHILIVLQLTLSIELEHDNLNSGFSLRFLKLMPLLKEPCLEICPNAFRLREKTLT
ncbi:hypothetical protein D8674_020005 [Pyrus ussuriensis x Pyrus communis]|uniref:Uncharacterized protein n=1 Tax=Pyrus ussuriensis x Pyrus communis TaxID=2448454 RepID=A0A5N5G9L9_9ROSA|nr:hypothetical protein D8674_020005 [Pyrus ussuriensis x Pyrus communis]